MKTRRKINVSQITVIGVMPEKISKWIQWFPKETKYFGLYTEPEGFWTTRVKYLTDVRVKDENIWKETIEKDPSLRIEGKLVYNKASIRIHLSDGSREELYFDTDTQMFEFINRPEFKDITLVEI